MEEELKQTIVKEEPNGLQEKSEEKSKEVDLVTRVSQISKSKEQEPESKFNINDLDTQIERISDPVLKDHVIGLKKSLLRGENQKYQEIASLRKQYETKLAEVSTWTPERLKQEINKPDFVNAAQSLYQSQNPSDSGLTEQQWSTLSEVEKAELNQLKQKIASLEKNSYETIKTTQDEQLKQRYANYDPTSIDRLTQDLMTGKLQATREHLHKVLDYDDAVKRAYELGLMDRNSQNQEKVKGMTFDSVRSIPTGNNVKPEKGETPEMFFRRSYQEHSKK